MALHLNLGRRARRGGVPDDSQEYLVIFRNFFKTHRARPGGLCGNLSRQPPTKTQAHSKKILWRTEPMKSQPCPFLYHLVAMELDQLITRARAALGSLELGQLVLIAAGLVAVILLFRWLLTPSIPSITIDDPTGIYSNANARSCFP